MFRRFRTALLAGNLAEKRSGYVLGALGTAGIGLLLLLTVLGDGLTRLSYDLPFILQNSVPGELVMVYFDPAVKYRLGQPIDQPLNRRFHAELVERLRVEGAKLVVFDVLFTEPAADLQSDEQFAQAIRSHGRVVLAAESVKGLQANVLSDVTVPPLPGLRSVAAGYGLANIEPDLADSAVRRLDPGNATDPSLAWVAAKLLGAEATRQSPEHFRDAWLNYYCWPRGFQSFNLDQLLAPGGVTGRFRDKLVVVGRRPENQSRQREPEEFASPYSKRGGGLSPGAAVHALTLLNLVRGDWLHRCRPGQEELIVVAWGLAISLLLMRLSPWYAIGTGLLGSAAFATLAALVQLRYQLWFAWAIPAAAQTAAALIWSVGYQYLVESRRRKRLVRALAAYVSPSIAEKVANAGFDLSPGGKEVEATVMFTDLENFMKLSEGLAPAEISRILIAYFRETQRAIFEQDGTVIKFIGDAVMAAWGAPLPDPNPAERAVMAALNMRQTGCTKIEGRHLRTRIGINSGLVLAGNLGTETKLDYTLIGDAINIAARLESLNKQLGTDILISDATRAPLSNRIQLRDLGRFVLSGKTNPVGIYEVLAIDPAPVERPAWLAAFDEARARFVEGNLTQAETLFRKVIELRDGPDGPARFFLEQIRLQGPAYSAHAWDGIIRLDTK